MYCIKEMVDIGQLFSVLGSPTKIDVHKNFHHILQNQTGVLSRSINMQLISRTTKEELETAHILLNGMDANNDLVPVSNFVDKNNNELTVRCVFLRLSLPLIRMLPIRGS